MAEPGHILLSSQRFLFTQLNQSSSLPWPLENTSLNGTLAGNPGAIVEIRLASIGFRAKCQNFPLPLM